jgi:hypothetical protein
MNTTTPGFVTGPPRLWLRFEGLAVLALTALVYARGGYSWGLFALLFLAPDLSFLAYLVSARVGAGAYNAVHSHVAPLALAGWALVSGRPLAVALIWTAHIGFDRLLGYGLKYPTAFRDTHLGQLPGRRDQGATG